jgi:membrane-associated protein
MISLQDLVPYFTQHYYLAYIFLFLGAYFETFIGIGFFLYGEIFFVSGAILAGLGDLNIWFVILITFIGGALGDSTGYFLGHKYGERLARRIFYKKKGLFSWKNYEKGKTFFHKYGKKSIFIGRFSGPVSCVIPFLSGTLKIKYLDFLKYNLPAVVIGISQFLIAGYIFGFSYTVLLPKIKRYLAYSILAVAIISYIIYKIYSSYRRKKNEKLKQK